MEEQSELGDFFKLTGLARRNKTMQVQTQVLPKFVTEMANEQVSPVSYTIESMR